MHPSRLKFHLIAIVSICVVITATYFLLASEQQAAPVVQSTTAIAIDHATWGKNCDRYIEQGIEAWVPPKPGEKGMPKPAYAKHNNALPALQKACDGKLTCSVTATSDKLDAEPMTNCAKRLIVGYRCFKFDRLHITEVAQGNSLSISCREDDTSSNLPSTP